MHLNIVAAAYTQEIEAALEPFVYELVCEWQEKSYFLEAHDFY